MAVQPWGQQGSGHGGPPPRVPGNPYAGPQWPSPVQPAPAPAAPVQLPQSAMRAAHTDRDRTVDVLKAAYAEGRLSSDEYSQRFDAASRAQTYGELAQIVADLPSGPMVAPMSPPMAVPVAVPVAVPATFLPAPVPAPPTNGAAVTSLVLGLLTVTTMGMTGLPAVITGHIAKSQLRTRHESGDGMATTGLVLGYLSLVGWLFFLLAVTASF
ncbi:DUF1707 and DUF4190 domain-containing protein [Kitasatospora sp. NPDC054939]